MTCLTSRLGGVAGIVFLDWAAESPAVDAKRRRFDIHRAGQAVGA